MKHSGKLDETICAILSQYKRIAVVGLSNSRWRDSNRVASYMLDQGYVIYPVNPRISEWRGLPSYRDLASVPAPVEIVNIFRRTEHIPGIVEQAIAVGASAVWMQKGLEDEQSAERARNAGLMVVMDRCLMAEHSRHQV